MRTLLILFVCTFSTAGAWFWRSPEWGNLRVRFGTNPFRSDVFDAMPRTEEDAIDDGWTKIAECDTTGRFRGKRYILNNDRALVLLFDVNGYIAGIQCGLAKHSLHRQYPKSALQSAPFQDEGDFLTITAYFTDPSRICTNGRSAEEFARDGTGDNVYLQMGADPARDVMLIPRDQADLAGTPWTEGRCFVGMGDHYWYNTSANMRCEDFFPMFLLYEDKRLEGFGWAFGIGQDSPRFEHPPISALSYFFKDVPQCLSNYPEISTMHIYLTSYPWTNLCI